MKLLLHSCCGPCAIYPLKVLKQTSYDVSCLFYNPNIHPYKEYKLRLTTFSDYMVKEGIPYFCQGDYGLIEFTRKIAFNETSRCSICYSMRMKKTVEFAAQRGFDAFTTTLLYSRYQQHDKIITLCKSLAAQNNIEFYYKDFRGGWQEGIDTSIELGMYRQPYCGCIYSEQERYEKSIEKKQNRKESSMLSMLVIATRNKNKLKEFQEILRDLQIQICSLDDFGPIPEAVEDGETFDDNAYKKALHTAKILGLPAIADDSGLVVESLAGAPGVHSARYASENATDEENLQKLLTEMRGVENRKAKFQCVLSIAVPSGPALTYEGSCAGSILEEKRGESGFGYDPVFYYEEFGKTFAELSMQQKNRVSHRGKALAQVKNEVQAIKKWLEQRLIEEKPPKPDHSAFAEKDWSDEM